MVKKLMVTVIITGLFLGLAISSFAVQKIKRDDLGRSVKLRILVDKVMIRAKKIGRASCRERVFTAV